MIINKNTINVNRLTYIGIIQY